jgi:hypothetical protein
MSASDYLEQKLLDHLFNEASYSAPTIYVALSTTTPTDTGNVTEPVDAVTPYIRKALGATTRTNSTVTNDADVTFPIAGTNWGTITHFALYDAESGGNLLGSGQLTVQKTVSTGDTVKFSAGSLTVTLD